MIILSGVLVVLAIALLVTGIVTGNTGHELLGLDGLKLIYVSIGVSIVSALFLAVGVFLRRKELFGTTSSPAEKAAGGRTSARPVKAKARVGAGDGAPTIPATSATATDVPAEMTVYVVPGRKRYHLETCRQLAGRDKEELTFLEAREEGFTPCTACLPDTALAARAALTDAAPATGRPDGSADTPVEVTRTDIPAARPPAEPRPYADTRDDIREPGRTRELPAETAASGAETTAEHTTAEPPAAEPPAAGHTTTEPPAAETAAVEEAAAVEPPAERPRRRRSMFEPLDRPGTEPATGRTASGGADDEATPERAGTGTRDDDETDVARDEAVAATDETARHTGTVAGAGNADDDAAAEDAEPRHHGAETDAVGDTSGAPAASGTARPGEQADTGRPGDEQETADPHGEASDDTVGTDATRTGTPEADETAAEPRTDVGDAADDDAGAADHTSGTAKTAKAAEAAEADEATTAEPEAEPEDDTADADAEPAEDDDAPVAVGGETESDADGPAVRVLSGTKRYHRPDCALIEGIADDADDLESLSRAEAKERGCTPCLVCQPDDD